MNHIIKGNFDICVKPNKLLTGNGQLVSAETGLYLDY